MSTRLPPYISRCLKDTKILNGLDISVVHSQDSDFESKLKDGFHKEKSSIGKADLKILAWDCIGGTTDALNYPTRQALKIEGRRFIHAANLGLRSLARSACLLVCRGLGR